ncbi:MAG: AI-2E family transporter [Acidobacteriota bacterium]
MSSSSRPALLPKEIRQRGARFLFISASLVIVIAGLREIRPIALPLLIAIFLVVLSSPVFSWLAARLPVFFAVLSTVLTNLAVLVVMGLMVGGSVRAFTESLPDYQQRFEDRAGSAVQWLEDFGVDVSQFDWLQSRTEDLPSPLEDESDPVIGFDAFLEVVSSTLLGIAGLLTRSLLVLLLMVFLLFESRHLPRKLEIALGWSPAAMRRMTTAKLEVQRYLIYKTLISLGTGVAAGLWVALLGVNFPVLWGLIAFLLNYIPSLGSIIASGPPLVLAWIDSGTATALVVVLGYLVINITLGNFVEPHLMGRRLGISTLVVFLSLVFWGWMWGPVGMLLSVPLTMILRIAAENTEDLRWVAQLIAANPANTRPVSRPAP